MLDGVLGGRVRTQGMHLRSDLSTSASGRSRPLGLDKS